MLGALLHLIAGVVSLTYVVLDGHFGNHNALQMARQHHLHLISKLRYDAALYFPYMGPYAGRGPHRKYGDKVHYNNIPRQYLKETSVEGHIETRLYQAQLLHKDFTQPLNVVTDKKNKRSFGAPWLHLSSALGAGKEVQARGGKRRRDALGGQQGGQVEGQTGGSTRSRMRHPVTARTRRTRLHALASA